MSDLKNGIYGGFEIPKVKIDEIKSMGKDLAEQVAENIIGGKFNLELEKIAKDIIERQDNAKAMEFTESIGTLLRENGVMPIITEYRNETTTDNGYKCQCSYAVESLDFSEHDKVFEDKIKKLERDITKLHLRCITDVARESFDKKDFDNLVIVSKGYEKKIYELQQRITELEAELEGKETECCEKPINDNSKPSTEWYDNRHQSDCIEINRLNTTVDVLIHKIEYLRQFAGLE